MDKVNSMQEPISNVSREMNMTEERISKFQNISIETSKTENKGDKDKKQNNTKDYGTTTKDVICT